MFVATLRITVSLQVVFGSLTILYVLLAISTWTGNATLGKVAGWEGVFVGLSAMYGSIAQIWNEVYGHVVLPLGPGPGSRSVKVDAVDRRSLGLRTRSTPPRASSPDGSRSPAGGAARAARSRRAGISLRAGLNERARRPRALLVTSRFGTTGGRHERRGLVAMSAVGSDRVVRAPRGTQLSCKGWQQEAALRMLMNNLDPEVAERPAGPRGLRRRRQGGPQLGRPSTPSWPRCKRLGNDETLLVQSGKPVGVFTRPTSGRRAC